MKKKQKKKKMHLWTGWRYCHLDYLSSFQEFEANYPEIIENIREAIQSKLEAEQGCLKNEQDEEEEENTDSEKAESLKTGEEDDEPDVKAATKEEE